MEGEVERRRRVHLKSRAGCVNCKARRIKCQETRPSCANCDRKNLACIYRKTEKEGPLLIVKQPVNAPQWSSSRFSMTDMQFFHHYLISAANLLPSERVEVWTVDLPRIAHQHEFLLHAFLSFGGTHLSNLGCSKDSAAAIEHRLAALHGMSGAMQSLDQCDVPDQSIHDALLATCTVLQMQSTFIGDGFQDFMIMGRGSGHMMQRMGSKTIDDWQLRSLVAYVDRSFRVLDPGTLAFRELQAGALISSLTSLEPSCLTTEEKAFCFGMNIFSSYLQQPQYEPHGQAGSLWTNFANMSIESWTDLIDTHNICSQKLLAHFCAILLLLRPNYPKLQYGNIEREPLPALTTWIRELSGNIARLSKGQSPGLSEANPTDLGALGPDCGYDVDGSPKSSASTCSTGFAYDFVPLQIANECDYRSNALVWSSSTSGGFLTPEHSVDCNALTQYPT